MSKEADPTQQAFGTGALRLTPQRQAVLECLVRAKGHPTAEEIHRRVSGASRATVYNNLRALARAGLVREMAVPGKAARFEAHLEKHHHFLCERCGGLEDVGWFDIPQLERRRIGSRVVRRYEIVFRGVCAACSGIQRRKGDRK